MESTKDLEFDQELVAEEELEAEEQLEPEEHFEPENELLAKKEYRKDVILTSLVLIHDHQMDLPSAEIGIDSSPGSYHVVAMSTTEERSSHNRNKHLIEALTTEMGQIFDSHLAQIRQEHHRARKRKEQELKSKPPDNSLRSTQSIPHKIPHTPKSKSVFHSDYKPTNALFKFSGKEDYLEWEKNMDKWFSYKNFLSEMRFVCALSHLTGDAYKWWLQQVDDRLYYKEPPITLWRDLKKLLRNKYAPQALECTPKGNPKIQGLAAQEKEQKAKSTSQPKIVTEEVVVQKQSLKPSLEPSVEPMHCDIMEHENDKIEESTKEENHHLVSTTSQACRTGYVSKITILNKKGPPYVSQPVLNRDLPKEEPRQLVGFTQVEAVMVHKQSPRAECNIVFKDKPPDATPPFKTENGALIKAEPCLLVYSDFMTMITHLLFAKGVDNIAGIKEEPPDLEFLMSNLFERTEIGVVLMPKIDYPFNRTRRKSDTAYELGLQGELDLRSNPFQVGEDDVIMESTKDLEFDQELVAEEELEAEEQLEPEEHFEPENELLAEKEYRKDVILTSLVLIHDHQMELMRPVPLDHKGYGYWKIRMIQLIRGEGEDAWTALEDGWEPPLTTTEEGLKGSESATQIWDILQKLNEGDVSVKRNNLDQLAIDFENMRMDPSETIVQFNA
ncbi:hypothetical protein AXX17_AT2G03730 [Arabidopsis thaliana]|uniref:Retrotransposon gag domain-containing protein n=1 Tax=Arabidopsis thaliana TaxID=3702 RepID=A0A178VVN4_ARATH|nr:hypothetical protein AXX17_AT2G03730 [Arabidopsis thaliana]